MTQEGLGSRGAGCRDRPRLGRCALVSLRIRGRADHLADVGSRGPGGHASHAKDVQEQVAMWPQQGSGGADVHRDGGKSDL